MAHFIWGVKNEQIANPHVMTRRGTYHVHLILLKYKDLSGFGFQIKKRKKQFFCFSGGHVGDVSCDEERPNASQKVWRGMYFAESGGSVVTG